MGLVFVRWKKYQDQNHPENTDVAAFSLPEVLGTSTAGEVFFF